MRETEYLGLITMVYDYEPNFAEHEITSENPLIAVVHEVANFLTRKKFFTKDGQPTKKLYKLVDKYYIHIKQLEPAEETAEDETCENQE